MYDGSKLPLAALRAFEAAARLESFTKAAAELAMTQAAVSYQIRQLEQRFEVALFRRAGRSVVLTPVGRRLAEDVLGAFAQLRGACLKATEDARGRLAITTLPTMAHWLAPRLGDFQQRRPQYVVQLDSSVEARDLRAGEYDIAIRIGDGEWPGCSATKLFQNEYTVVCGPDLVDEGRLVSPSELLELPLFGHEGWWHSWLEVAGVPHERLSVTDLGTQPFEVRAALAQAGAAVVTAIFFRDELAERRLAMPFDLVVPGHSSFWIVHCSSSRGIRKIKDFEEWLVEQVSEAILVST